MSPKDFFDLVAKMREMQKRYYKDRSSMTLSVCKKLEKHVDAEVERVKGIVEPDGQLKLKAMSGGANGSE